MKNVLPHPQTPLSIMAYCGLGILTYSFKKLIMFLFMAILVTGFKVTEKSNKSELIQ